MFATTPGPLIGVEDQLLVGREPHYGDSATFETAYQPFDEMAVELA